MLYIYMNILRKDLINMYQIISLVYRKHVYGMVEGCRTLIVLYTLALLGFIFNDKPLFM